MQSELIPHQFVFKRLLDDLTPPVPSNPAAGGPPAPPPPSSIYSSLPSSKLTGIEFGMLQTSEILRLSQFPVVHRNLYQMNRVDAQPFGVLDRRLGTSVKKNNCLTCHRSINECVGHFAHISLELPVFHIGYFRETTRVLQMICKSCSRILLSPAEIERYRKKRSMPRVDPARANLRITEDILSQAKKVKYCPHCTAPNSTVKKLSGAFKLVHEIKKADERKAFLATFDLAVHANKQLAEHIHRAVHDLNPLVVLSLFRFIPDEDCTLMNLNTETGRPEEMLVQQLLVPPNAIRPSVQMGTSGSNEDDLTVKLGDIVFINSVIRSQIEKGATPSNIMENWDFLQQQVAMYVNADLPGFPKNFNQGRPIRALIQRLKGKQGRFRGNLSGKRVDFSSRTVISPDPNLRVDQVGVPELVAKTLTYPERVQANNLKRLRQAVINGPDVHPGANTVEFANGTKIFLKYGDRKQVANNLRFGDLVERHIHDDDICLFNRQPSLHRMSIMAHRAKVLQWRTFRFNECVCSPYNADFDGDEMNLHVPQTEEARSEALCLMGIQNNLVTPRHGEPLITATQDFLTTAYLITQKDVFYDKFEFCQICCYFTDGKEDIELPPPAIFKPLKMWTGKQIFSLLIRPNKTALIARLGVPFPIVNIELKERNFENKSRTAATEPWMCARDGYVVIKNSELMCGNIAKTTIGGDKTGLLYSLTRDYSMAMAGELLNKLAKLSARWIGNRGFSIGIDDVTPSFSLTEKKADLLEKGYSICDDNIAQWKAGNLQCRPGCNEEQTLESICLKELSDIREALGNTALKELNYHHNSPLIMAVCGSKGSKINISQMVSCVGQQAVNGSRIPEGFVHRTLPHFSRFSRDPDAKGFVKNSFFSGLTASEFFFHTMAGREGLVDTAVKTAETGYMQRRLMKALEDLCVQYDSTVRTSDGNIVQFTYGDDGLDPITMTASGLPVNFPRCLDNILAEEEPKDELKEESKQAGEQPESRKRSKKQKQVEEKPKRQREPPLLPQQINKHLAEKLASPEFAHLSYSFTEKLKEFLNNFSSEMQALLDSFPKQEKHKKSKTASQQQEEEDNELSSLSAAHLHLLNQCKRLTRSQLDRFLSRCLSVYRQAVIEPGTAVGAIAGQSIGEPGTQMTLKTFHFAGVASMNVTLGVPRIKEIINAAKKISSPIITAPLDIKGDVRTARVVKGRIEKTKLGEISSFIDEVLSPTECFLRIKLDMKAISALQLDIDAASCCRSIHEAKLKVRAIPKGSDLLQLLPTDGNSSSLLFSLQRIKQAVTQVVVKGVPLVNRAVINNNGDDQSPEYTLLVEGYNLRGVMGVLGVDGRNCWSNHVEEMRTVLGIEAARTTIMKEILMTMESHGLSLDPRHVALLADIMSYRGEILGITRFGVAKMRESVLMLASFEKTADHLFEAAVRGTKDKVSGVSECIIMGNPIPIGTGLFNLMHKAASGARLETNSFDRSSLLLNSVRTKLKI